MDTQHLTEELTAYLAGELNRVDRRRVEAHLGECAECAALLEKLKKVDELLGHAPPLEPSADFASRVLRRAEAERKVVRFRARNAAAWIALAAVLVFALLILRVQRDVNPPPPAPARPAAKQIAPPAPPTVTPAKQAPAAAQAEPAPSEEDRELIAHLDELENMDVIKDYETLEDLHTSILGSQMEQSR